MQWHASNVHGQCVNISTGKELKFTVTISLPNLFWSRAWCDVASLLQGQSRVSLLSGVTSWHLLCWSSHNICNASHGKLDNGVEIMIFNGCMKGVDNEPDLFWHFTNWLCIRVCCLCPLPLETKKNQVHCPPLSTFTHYLWCLVVETDR